MKRILIATFVLAAATAFGQYRDSYGQPGNGGGGYDPYYGNYDPQGYRAPAPPPPPAYYYNGYRRPRMPGPGYVWVDPCWNYQRGGYVWVNGYWARPPFAGGYWSAPRYSSGRFYVGFWASGRNNGRVGFGYRGGGRGHNRR